MQGGRPGAMTERMRMDMAALPEEDSAASRGGRKMMETWIVLELCNRGSLQVSSIILLEPACNSWICQMGVFANDEPFQSIVREICVYFKIVPRKSWRGTRTMRPLDDAHVCKDYNRGTWQQCEKRKENEQRANGWLSTSHKLFSERFSESWMAAISAMSFLTDRFCVANCTSQQTDFGGAWGHCGVQEAIDKGAFRIRAGELNEGSPNMINILRTATEIAGAMSYLHSLDILHSDLNGNNILLISNTGIDDRPFSVKVYSMPHILSLEFFGHKEDYILPCDTSTRYIESSFQEVSASQYVSQSVCGEL